MRQNFVHTGWGFPLLHITIPPGIMMRPTTVANVYISSFSYIFPYSITYLYLIFWIFKPYFSKDLIEILYLKLFIDPYEKSVYLRILNNATYLLIFWRFELLPPNNFGGICNGHWILNHHEGTKDSAMSNLELF